MQPTVLKRIFIQPTLLFKDNYSYLLKDLESGLSALIDPANVKAIPPDQSINMVLATHHHFDHVGELAQVVAKLGNIKVYGGDDRVPCLTDKAQADFHLGSLLITPISTPCHTSASICYFVQDSANSEYALFTGDTLFAAGCGRFFEGSASDMYSSLAKLRQLPPETLVFCGHEYTTSNLQFATSVDKSSRLMEKLTWSKGKTYTLPSTIADEILTNPFMKVDNADFQQKFQIFDPVELTRVLRELKNKF